MNDLTEKEWMAQVLQVAKLTGWTHYHTFRSKRSPSGFPDLVLARDRVLFAELKTETGRATAEQLRWLKTLAAAGAETYLWRPSDLDQIGRVLGARERVAACTLLPRLSWSRPATPLLAAC